MAKASYLGRIPKKAVGGYAAQSPTQTTTPRESRRRKGHAIGGSESPAASQNSTGSKMKRKRSKEKEKAKDELDE